MLLSADNQQKKKGRAISSFLKKTYGLLNVPYLLTAGLMQPRCGEMGK